MLKDDKNEEYRDQIYYALADLDLEERNRPGGIDNLEKSLRANIDNQKQRAKSYLRLADLTSTTAITSRPRPTTTRVSKTSPRTTSATPTLKTRRPASPNW